MEQRMPKPNSELRAMALERLSGRWVKAILANLALFLPSLILGVIPALSLLHIFITGPLAAGGALFYLRFAQREDPDIAVVFSGFRNFLDYLALNLLMALYIFLWGLLLVIPGIVKAIGYSMAYFIKNDNPWLSANEAIDASSQMMQGHKWRFFLLTLSFIGWHILAILSFGIGFIWLAPYMSVAFTCFYLDLKACQAGEPGREQLPPPVAG
jgi:uncharacterized membrane protein